MLSDDEYQRARKLILEHGWNATAYQILNPGISLWFSSAGDGVIGFVRHRKALVVGGAPVCAVDRLGVGFRGSRK
jgi:phosphatidylglycerol lysyltransferase